MWWTWGRRSTFFRGTLYSVVRLDITNTVLWILVLNAQFDMNRSTHYSQQYALTLRLTRSTPTSSSG